VKLGLLTWVSSKIGARNHLVVRLAPLISLFRGRRRSLDKETSLWKPGWERARRDAAGSGCRPRPRARSWSREGYTHGGPRPACSVRVQLGSGRQDALDRGNRRRWKLGVASDPEPFTEMPVSWQNAFGDQALPTTQEGVYAIMGSPRARRAPVVQRRAPEALKTACPRIAPGARGVRRLRHLLAPSKQASKLGTYDQPG
jgi:hypothetical protein